jgi:hypothetical protein
MIKSFVMSIIIIICTIGMINAQERPSPPPRETEIRETERIEREDPERERLPEFELPEYVITGRATFRLPYVQKPKITEQNIFIADVSETMTGVNRDIDTTPVDLPTKSFGEFRTIPTAQHGQVQIGYGRFNTPVVSGWANLRSGPWETSLRLFYLNTEGHEPYFSGYDVDGRLQFGYRIPQEAPPFVRGGRPYFTTGFEGFKYGLYNQMISGPSIPGFPDPFDQRKRTFRTAYSEIGYRSGTEIPFDFDFALGWRGSTLDDDEQAPVPRLNDDELYLHMNTLGYIQAVRFRTHLEYIVNKLDFESEDELNDLGFFRGSVTVLFPVVEDFMTLELGGSFYATRHTHNDYTSSIKPVIEARLMLTGSMTAYGRFAPEVIHNSLYSLHHYNPYTGWWANPPRVFEIMASEEKINASAGLEFVPHRRLTVHAYSRYRKVEAYPGFYSLDTFGEHMITFLGTSTLFSVNADVRYAVTDRDIVTMQTSLRYTKNDFFETSIPYVAPVEIAAMYTREFPIGLRTTAGIEFLSTRRAAYEEGDSEALGTLVNLSLDVLYQFHNIVGLYVRLDNIVNQSYERYFTYPARPFYIEGGIQLSF